MRKKIGDAYSVEGNVPNAEENPEEEVPKITFEAGWRLLGTAIQWAEQQDNIDLQLLRVLRKHQIGSSGTIKRR